MGLKGDGDPLKEIAENGVYRLDPKGKITRVYSGLNRPNGLGFFSRRIRFICCQFGPKKKPMALFFS